MIRICVLWQSYGPYHFARLAALQKLCAECGHEVVGLEVGDKTSTYGWRRTGPGERGIVTLFPGRVAEAVSPLAVRQAAKKFLKQARCEVIFTPSYWPLYGVLAAMAARSLGMRVVMMNDSHRVTGTNSVPVFAVKKQIAKLYDAAFVAGSVHRGFHRELGFSDKNIFEGYDAVDNAYFGARADEVRKDAAQWRKRLGLPQRFILNIGRFVAKKNLPSLIKAFALARRRGWLNGCDLVLVGSGPEKDRLTGVAESERLKVVEGRRDEIVSPSIAGAEVVRFYPFAQIEELPAYYTLAECFVLPSLYEEWGLVVNEAMASGCAVGVSNAVGCASDLVVPGRTGFAFDPENIGQLADGLRSACQDQAFARQLGANARDHIAGWSCERFAENALKAAGAALAAPQRAASETSGAQATNRPAVVLLQTCFPDYREPVFDEIGRRFAGDFELICGEDYFTRDVKVCAHPKPWRTPAGNVFLFSRNLLWQNRVVERLCEADIALLELNPRVISSWVILLARRMSGVPTLLWGHVWARDGIGAWTNIIRLMMMRLSDGIIPYTYTQGKELQRRMPGLLVVTAPNSLVPKAACVAAIAPMERTTDIIFVGRVKLDKKPGLLLEAFALAIPHLEPEVRLVFVGEGPETASLKQRAGEHYLAHRVIFRGHVIDAVKLREIYSTAFCAVSPGYVGLSAIQSFAHGVPMVVADREPHSPEIEACFEGRNSRFFSSDNSRDLADKLGEMWRDRGTWWSKRADIASWVAEQYSVENMADGFESAVREIKDRRN
ncbi:glycosyltransferase family 4 protein [Opitutus sp. GAS368]|uniref:glycosyltransferase family 4 protein n=1 Tax=Opitutus sp. GAS368 TaxID=1882749 RepID=UPI00087BABE0|nr:glycosyltransferase family 4 protein [Opitutus sp. GAS368]SDS46437.1 Glycosyltransferase involved in cell wall bisynthesis [Opitutus sp. GAS368]